MGNSILKKNLTLKIPTRIRDLGFIIWSASETGSKKHLIKQIK